MFWRVVQVYAVSPDEVLKWPVRRFWGAASYADRIQAHRDLSMLDLMAVSNSMGDGESFSKHRAMLIERIGTTVIREEPRMKRDEILEIERLFAT